MVWVQIAVFSVRSLYYYGQLAMVLRIVKTSGQGWILTLDYPSSNLFLLPTLSSCLLLQMKQHGENKSCYRETLLSSQHTHILAYLSYYSGRSILTPTDGQLLCSDGKESTCNAGDLGLIPGSGRTPGEGNGNPLQYSCLENPMDRGA